MTVVNPKSISGINSITTGSGSDDLLTIHTNNGTERLRIDSTGATKIVTGIVTTLTATTGIVTSLEATTGDITTLRAPTGIVTSLIANTARATTGIVTTLTATTGIVTTLTTNTAQINTTNLTSTKMAIQSTATSGSGNACGLRVGNNVGALSKYPADLELRTTGVQNYNGIRVDAGDGNGGFTAGVQGYNGFLNLTTGGTDVVGVKLSADGNTNFFNGSSGLNASVGIGTTVVGGATNLTLGRRDTSNEGGELAFCRANDGTQYWQIDCYGNDDTPTLRFHAGGAVKALFPASGGISPSGEANTANYLTDYEEGTYIPVISASGVTYTYSTNYDLRSPSSVTNTNSISYVKIGSMVYLNFAMFWNTSNTIRYLITLPFTAKGSAYALCITPASFQVDIDGDILGTLGLGNNSTAFDTYRILKDTGTGGHGNVPLTASSEVYYTLAYEAL